MHHSTLADAHESQTQSEAIRIADSTDSKSNSATIVPYGHFHLQTDGSSPIQNERDMILLNRANHCSLPRRITLPQDLEQIADGRLCEPLAHWHHKHRHHLIETDLDALQALASTVHALLGNLLHDRVPLKIHARTPQTHFVLHEYP